MENKNQAIIIGLLMLIAGLLLGYFFGVSNMPHRGFFLNDSMHEEAEEHMGGYGYDNEIVRGNGEFVHMMDEMMLIGRGQTGEAYEEAWLRGMIVHHIGAVRMSENLLEQTDRPELIDLANNIIESQSAEIKQMESWLKTWFNEK